MIDIPKRFPGLLMVERGRFAEKLLSIRETDDGLKLKNVLEVEANAVNPADLSYVEGQRADARPAQFPSPFGESACGTVVRAAGATDQAVGVGTKLGLLALGSRAFLFSSYVSFSLNQPSLVVFPVAADLPCERVAAAVWPVFHASALLHDIHTRVQSFDPMSSVVVLAIDGVQPFGLVLTQMLARRNISTVHIVHEAAAGAAGQQEEDAAADIYRAFGATQVMDSSALLQLDGGMADQPWAKQHSVVLEMSGDRRLLPELLAAMSFESDLILLDKLTLTRTQSGGASGRPLELHPAVLEQMQMSGLTVRGFSMPLFLAHATSALVKQLISETTELIGDASVSVPFTRFEASQRMEAFEPNAAGPASHQVVFQWNE